MRKLFVIFMLMPFCLQAQIDIRKEEVKYTPVYKPVAYDSLQPFLYEKKDDVTEFRNQFKKYIGQDIFLIPNPKKNDSMMTEPNYVAFRESGFKFYCPNKYTKFLVGQHENQIQEVKHNKVVVNYETVYYYDSTNVYKAVYLGNPKEIRWGTDVKIEEKYYCTPYSAYLGKYFKIVDVIFDERFSSSGRMSFVLLDDQQDTVVFSSLKMVDAMSYESFYSYPEFMFVGYYMKMKELYEGKEFVYFGNKGQYNWDGANTTVDIQSGENVSLTRGSEWFCVGLQLMEVKEYEKLQLYLVFKNDSGNQIKVRIKKRRDDKNPVLLSHFYEKDEYLKMKEEERLSVAEKERRQAEEAMARKRKREKFEKDMVDKFGDKVGNLIINGQVVIGMNKEMCRYSWGKPIEINTTTVANHVHEQWVYSGYCYLYFDDGVLTAIQN